jgi:choline dehydrogenase-like flavoprotein
MTRSGWIKMRAPARLPLGGDQLGTARMSESPTAGVVNADGRVHCADNLYVASYATFPTSGQVNPILTIVVIALRLAQYLKIRLGGRFV